MTYFNEASHSYLSPGSQFHMALMAFSTTR